MLKKIFLAAGSLAMIFFFSAVYVHNSSIKRKEREYVFRTEFEKELFAAYKAMPEIQRLTSVPYGEEYLKIREQLLNSDSPEALKKKLQKCCLNSHLWDLRLQAYILIGWLENRNEYRAYEELIDSSFKGEFKYTEVDDEFIDGRIYGGNKNLRKIGDDLAKTAITSHGPKILPLTWEAIWKRKHDGKDARKFVYYTILNYLPRDKVFVTASIGMLRSSDIQAVLLISSAIKSVTTPADAEYLHACNPMLSVLPKSSTETPKYIVDSLKREAFGELSRSPGALVTGTNTYLYEGAIYGIVTEQLGCKFAKFIE